MPEISCRWAKTQLPLWVGGDLIGADRRRVERHLLRCSDCRSLRDHLSQSLTLLHVLANQASRTSAEPPSLWPALAQQIHESRHAVPSAAPWWRLFAWPMTGLSAAALLIASVAISGRPKAPGIETPTQSVVTTRPALPTTSPKEASSQALSANKVDSESDSPTAPVPLPIPASSREPQPSS